MRKVFISLTFLVSFLSAYASAPLVMYTDILSGPTSGGENNKGSYLSIFGKNFGTTGLGSTVRVYIGTAEIDNYRYLGTSLGRPDIQQITVQIGALGNAAAGTALPVKVVVGGAQSNTDKTFTPNPGRILFVDNSIGNDATAVVGDITHPFRHVQTTSATAGAYGQAQPGDAIVMRGKGTTYSDTGLNNCFLRFLHKSGSAPTGASITGPIAVMAYPTETVNITNGYAAISGVDRSNTSYQDGGAWITISNLHIVSSGTSGVVNLQIAADHWRIVNNDLSEPNAATIAVLAGGITGNGTNVAYYGNGIHDITGSAGENHGIYVDGDGSYDIAYNHIYNVNDGYGIQQYNNGTNGSNTTNNFWVHHNLIHDVTSGKSCINVADGSDSSFRIWDNVCYNSRNSGLRFNSLDLAGCRVYNNTFYNCDVSKSYGAIQNDWNTLASSQVVIDNNIVWPTSGGGYLGGQGFGAGAFSHNLWQGSGTAPSADAAPVSGNPSFAVPGSDFHLLAGSPAIDAGVSSLPSFVVDDFDGVSRPQGVACDVGAYEYIRPAGTINAVSPGNLDAVWTIRGAGPLKRIDYTLPIASTVQIQIVTVEGKWVADLVDSRVEAGTYSVDFSTKSLSHGSYLFILKEGRQIFARQVPVP